MFKIIFILGFLFLLGALVFIYFYQEKLIFYPSKLKKDFQYRFPVNFEEHNIEVDKGVELNTLLFKVPQSKGVILYFHGNAGDLSTWGDISQEFTRYGYDILIIDYRGYGKSDGKITSEAQLYSDAEKVYDYLQKKYTNIIIYGRSIGTGIASYLAAYKKIDKLILETPYYNLTKMVKHYFPLLPTFIIKYRLANNEHLKKVTAPVTIMHGTLDEVIPFENSVLLKQEFKNIQFYRFQDAYHNNLSEHHEYRKVMDEIFGED